MFCEIALVLLLDASTSLSMQDWRQQVQQTANAIRSEEVINAIERAGPIAIRPIAFSDTPLPMLEWHVLRTRQDAQELAAALDATSRPLWGGTSIGGALAYSIRQLADTPCTEVGQQIIDLSTDGESAEPETIEARDAAQEMGIRINAIGVGSSLDMERLRRTAVTMDGFLIEATSWDEYPLLFRRKILLELTARD